MESDKIPREIFIPGQMSICYDCTHLDNLDEKQPDKCAYSGSIADDTSYDRIRCSGYSQITFSAEIIAWGPY